MKIKLFSLAAMAAVLLGGMGHLSAQDVFYPITGVSVAYPDGAGGAFFPERNLIQGPGVGFDAQEPYDALLFGADGTWVTDACGFPCDYIEVFGEPVITLDLGANYALNEVSVWGYASGNSNGLQEFALRFATDAEGPMGFGTSIGYAPEFTDVDILPEFRQSFPFSQEVTARYVEFTPLANYFEPPGDGSNGEIPGGDRVGIGEIAFQAPDDFVPPPPPEPSVKFYAIDSIESSTADFDLWPAQNLIQGPGVGFLADEPFDRISGGDVGAWVTEACGFPCDYLDAFDPPELYIDLGEDVPLSEINVWGYADTNSNGVSEFSLSFATEADGPNGYGTSISYEPTFGDVELPTAPRQVFPFDETVTARYVRFTATDNHFIEPGDGSGGEIPGGDRVGLGEIAFPIPGASVPGDFTGDGQLTVEDIDLLLGAVAGGMNPADFDLTSDGSVNTADINFWVEDLKNTWVGDADLDGDFDSGDFVAIFTAGKFETGEPASWSEGDWNGDGQFNSSDFVSAFTGGGFELGPRAAVSAVPEPSSLSLLGVAAMLGMGGVRRRFRCA